MNTPASGAGSRDRALVYAAAALRGSAVNLSGVLLGLYLATIGLSASRIGAAISLGLAGCAAATLAAVFYADRIGRRRSLTAIALLMAAGGIALALISSTALLLVAVFIGMVNGMGRDRGAALTIEQAILPRTTTDQQRTRTFAWYNLAGDFGSAGGALLAGLPALLRHHRGMAGRESYQVTWIIYAAICLGLALLAARLSSRVESEPGGPRPNVGIPGLHLSPGTRPILARFAALSMMDSLGGGLLNSALISYWFFRRFGFDESFLGPFFFAVRLLNAASHLGAAWLAKRFGLVNTMVFTHLPSSLLLLVAAFVPHPGAAIALFLLRESLVEMDVPTRQSYVTAIVPERDRTSAAGVINLVRSTSWAVAPAGGGALMGSVALSAPLLGGACLKIAYDLLLYRAFRHLKPPEERPPGPHPRGAAAEIPGLSGLSEEPSKPRKGR